MSLIIPWRIRSRRAPVVAIENDVPPGGNLQAALNLGGETVFSGTHVGNFKITQNGTRLIGNNAAVLVGAGEEALTVMPGVSDVVIENITMTAPNTSRAVLRLGAADSTQTSTSQEPHHIILEDIIVPTHRGKRAFEINARDVTMISCECRDVYSSALQDSQAIGINNSSGNINVIGGYFEAASENILMGGDFMKMVGVVPTNVTFDSVTLTKPIDWRTDGVRRVVKNLFEVKNGKNVTLKNSTLSNCWVDGQTGNAIVLTPTRDGQVTGITIDNCNISNVGNGIQLIGRHYDYYTPTRLDLQFTGCTLSTNHTLMGGRGWWLEASAEPLSIILASNNINVGGTKLMDYSYGTVHIASTPGATNGTDRDGGPLGELIMVNNAATCPKWGITLDGFVNGGPNKEGFAAVEVMDVSANIFSGPHASLMRTNFPNNTYI